MRLLSVCLIVCLVACTHQPESVRVYHYGTQGTGQGNSGIHTVQSGDTIWSISQNYNLPLRDLIDLNRVTPPYYLLTGMRLLLPTPSTYRVRDKDTLFAISRLFHISVTDLSRLNHLQSPYIIRTGQILQVPSSVGHVDLAAFDSEGQTYVPKDRQAQREEKEEPVKSPVYTHRKPIENSKSIALAPRQEARFLSPVKGKVISSFGAKKNSLHNDGINIKAPRGASVRAAENGVIVYANDELEGYGNLILLKHTDGYVTAYAHMDKLIAKKGLAIKRGEVIGTVGSTGNVKTPQLHFELRRGTKVLNPKGYMTK